MGWTESDLAEHYKKLGMEPPPLGASAKPRPQPKPAQKPKPLEGPINETLILYGHCPSKKNDWERRQSGVMILPPEVKEQIEVLTTQAFFHWRQRGPVEHPQVTFRFFVAAKRQDQDGMYTTILDCLQAAGVIVNDNIAHFNGRKILEPCEFVNAKDERVEIQIVKV